MIESISQIVLGVGSLFAALLLYRQSQPLTAQSKVIASLLAICCFFISASALLSLLIVDNSEATDTFTLMLRNLHFFLAIPLFSSILLASCVNKQFSKATWGRWSLVLIAIFELCRRAEIGQLYSDLVIYSSCLAVTYSLLSATFLGDKQKLSADLLYKSIAIISYTSSLLLFSDKSIVGKTSDATLYNITLTLGLVFIYLLSAKKLTTVQTNH